MTALASASGAVAVSGGAATAGVKAHAVQRSAPPNNFLPASRKGRAPATVNIDLAGGYQVQYLPTFVAMGAGYFKQVEKRFHTTIAFDSYGTGASAEPAFLSGQDPFIVTSLSISLAANASGRSQVSVFGEGVDLAAEVVAPLRNKANGTDIAKFGPPDTWCDIGTSGLLNTVARLEAATAGLSISQLKLTNIGSTAATLPTLQSGLCDISMAAPPDAAIGLVNGSLYIAANLVTPQATVPIAGEFTGPPLQTSAAFAHQYPQFTQAIVDAELEGLQFIQSHLNNAGAIYRALPAAMKAGLPLGAFVQAMTLATPGFKANVDSGAFSSGQINDSLTVYKALGQIPTTGIDPTLAFSNKYILQAYKDLGVPAPTGVTAAAVVHHTIGTPSSEAAAAYAALTGLPVPANSGPSPMAKIK
jgi:ABC-type nitrate/sulfonate/bicarbonate transport system substrate-binding protein